MFCKTTELQAHKYALHKCYIMNLWFYFEFNKTLRSHCGINSLSFLTLHANIQLTLQRDSNIMTQKRTSRSYFGLVGPTRDICWWRSVAYANLRFSQRHNPQHWLSRSLLYQNVGWMLQFLFTHHRRRAQRSATHIIRISYNSELNTHQERFSWHQFEISLLLGLWLFVF